MLDDSMFPSLQEAKPVVKLPSKMPVGTMSVEPVANAPSVPDFEGHMRNMILRNEGVSAERRDRGADGFAKPSQPSDTAHRRPIRKANQNERRQRNAEGEQLMINMGRPESLNKANATRRQPRTQQYDQDHRNYAGEHSAVLPSGQYSTSVAPHLRGQQRHGKVKSDQLFPRPPPQHRKLFDPSHNGQQNGLRSQNNQQFGTVNRGYVANIQDQIEYVDFYARNEILRAEISPEEHSTKQALKTALEEICRRTVAEFETKRVADFATNTIELKSFGSLSTTFATKDSDMDLVLLSPNSVPDASSTDSPLPRLIEKALLEQGFGARLLTRTRVPIIKFCEEPSPELAQRLRNARLEWEKEKDAPAPAKKQEANQKKEANTNVNKDGRQDPTLPHNRPHTVKEYISPKGGPLQILDPTATIASNTELSESHSTIEYRSTEQPPEATTLSAATDLEGDDPLLESKTDEERARLYLLAIKEDWYEPAERGIISDFVKALEAGVEETALNGFRQKLKTLPNILKRYRPAPEKHLDFPKDGVGIQCDINFSNLLALHNSALLRCYSLCDPRVRLMVLFIKAWAKKRKINSAYESTLSSYGYVLMVLHYLVNITSPPVVPNLQHYHGISRDEISSKVRELDGYNIQFFRNENVLRKLAGSGQFTQNQESVGSLVRGFFQYFGSDGWNNFHWMRDVISLRTKGGILTKQSKGWIAAKTETIEAGLGPKENKDIRQRYLLAIEDPFETQHNVGRTVSHDGIVAIRDEFRRANRLIQAAGLAGDRPENLFAEGESKGNLQYRFFGPRPRRINAKTNSNRKKATEAPKTNGDVKSDVPHGSTPVQKFRIQKHVATPLALAPTPDTAKLQLS